MGTSISGFSPSIDEIGSLHIGPTNVSRRVEIVAGELIVEELITPKLGAAPWAAN